MMTRKILSPVFTVVTVLSATASLPAGEAFNGASIHDRVPLRSLSSDSTVGRPTSPSRPSPRRCERLDTKQQSTLSDWVVEGLEDGDSSITASSATKAGEGDTLPTDGLLVGRVRVYAADAAVDTTGDNDGNVETNSEDDVVYPVRLLVGRNGWGTGVHPTTRLCLEWLGRADVVQGGEVLLDYGCGSGILSIAGLHFGASRAIGVDVEAEALITAERNLGLNGFEDRFEGLHTREIVPGCLQRPSGVDICIANILIGQLVRPSMVSAITTNMEPGSLLCLSGIRPNEVDSLKVAYDDHVDWLDEHYGELSADETEGSIESYGFDVGRWARVVGRLKATGGMDIESMSELAVS